MSRSVIFRFFRRAFRVIRFQSTPFGLISIRYCLPRLSPTQAAHRTLLKNSLPQLPQWLSWILNRLLLIRWVLFYAWQNSYRAIRYFGDTVKQHSNIGIGRQSTDILLLAILHGVPPSAYYNFKFYLPEQKKRFWQYLFDHEIASFHTMRDGPGSPELVLQRQLLANKFGFANTLNIDSRHIAQSILVQKHSSCEQLLVEARLFSSVHDCSGKLFCKPNSASRAIGAFSLFIQSDTTFNVQLLNGSTLTGDTASRFIQLYLENHDYLIQPIYRNHSTVEILEPANNEAVTLRIITQNTKDDREIYCSYLETPLYVDNKKYYVHVSVKPDTGEIESELRTSLLLDYSSELEMLRSCINDLYVPDWELTRTIAEQAHQQLATIHAIAWDFILTPTGPVLLEGNTNWNTEIPQKFLGGLLKTETLER